MRYNYKEEGNKVVLEDKVLNTRCYGELYKINGKTYVKANTKLEMNKISRYRKENNL